MKLTFISPKNILLLFAALALSLGGFSSVKQALAQDGDCNNDPSIKISENIPVDRDYNIWVLSKKASSDAKSFVRIDNGECIRLKTPTGDGWEWVSGDSSTIKRRLRNGQHSFTATVDAGSMYMDRILVTSKLDCTPKDKGDNCLEPVLDFVVNGISPGQELKPTDKPVVEAQLIDNTIFGAAFSFYFDNNSSNAAKDSAAPYCFQAEQNKCTSVSLSGLSEGDHRLNVVATTPAGQSLRKSINFSIRNPQPDPEPEPQNPEPQNPDPDISDPVPQNPPADDPKLEFNVQGIKDNATVSGKLKIHTEIKESKPANASYVVDYSLDGDKLSGVWEKPYCLQTNKDGSCGEWDTTKVADGKHQLTVTVTKKPWDSKIAYTESARTYSITIQNKDSLNAAKENDSASNIIVVGNPKQKTKGKTWLTLPSRYTSYLNNTSKITYRINDRVVARLSAANPRAIVDTSGHVNGIYTATATITNANGSEEIFTTDIEVRNPAFINANNVVQQNNIAKAAVLVILLGIGGAAIYFVVKKIRLNKLVSRHMPHLEGTTQQDTTVGLLASKRSSKLSLASNKPLVMLAVVVVSGIIGTVAVLGTQALTTSVGFSAVFIEKTNAEKTHGDQFEGFPMGMGQHDHFPDGSMRAYYKITAIQPGGGNQEPEPDPEPEPDHPDSNPPGLTVDESRIPGPGSRRLSRSLVGRTGSNPPTSPSWDPTAMFRTNCFYSHMSFDDPIVYPGRPRAAHLHIFAGNTGVNAHSTPESVRTTGDSSCWGGTANRTAYWAPAIIDTRTNAPVQAPADDGLWGDAANFLQVYYKSGYNGVPANTIQTFPRGLRMIAGTASSTSPQPNNIVNFYCGTSSGDRGGFTSFPNCNPGELFKMSIEFPQCWDGKNLDSPDHKSHMAYGQGDGRGCPSTHPVALPEVTQIYRYRVPSSGMSTWRLSSDTYSGPAGFSAHADWMYGWDENVFKKVIDNCYNRNGQPRDCQMNLLGGGEELLWQ